MHCDPELQRHLATTAYCGLINILTMLPRHSNIDAEGIAAILRLIAQASDVDDPPPVH